MIPADSVSRQWNFQFASWMTLLFITTAPPGLLESPVDQSNRRLRSATRAHRHGRRSPRPIDARTRARARCVPSNASRMRAVAHLELTADAFVSERDRNRDRFFIARQHRLTLVDVELRDDTRIEIDVRIHRVIGGVVVRDD